MHRISFPPQRTRERQGTEETKAQNKQFDFNGEKIKILVFLESKTKFCDIKVEMFHSWTFILHAYFLSPWNQQTLSVMIPETFGI